MRNAYPYVAITLICALILLSYSNATPEAPGSKGIHVDNAWTRRAPMLEQERHGSQSGRTATLGNGAVYVTITNHGNEPDALVAATTDAAERVELHVTVERGGTMVMQPLPKFDIPAAGKLEMKPGGYHIMLLGLTRNLTPGGTVAVTLTFEKAGQMLVEAPVRVR
jgi:copper(I)-binding protein